MDEIDVLVQEYCEAVVELRRARYERSLLLAMPHIPCRTGKDLAKMDEGCKNIEALVDMMANELWGANVSQHDIDLAVHDHMQSQWQRDVQQGVERWAMRELHLMTRQKDAWWLQSVGRNVYIASVPLMRHTIVLRLEDALERHDLKTFRQYLLDHHNREVPYGGAALVDILKEWFPLSTRLRMLYIVLEGCRTDPNMRAALSVMYDACDRCVPEARDLVLAWRRSVIGAKLMVPANHIGNVDEILDALMMSHDTA